MTARSDFDAKALTWDQDTSKSDRARKVADAVAARVPGLAGARVLEYGAGTGLLGFALQGRVGHVTLADSSAEMLAVAREKVLASGARNVEVLPLDLSAGPAPSARWDVVCSLLVLHHVADVDGLLGRLREVLVPGGHLCLSDLDAEDGSFHGPSFTGHCGFDRVTLLSSLRRTGFLDARFETVFELERQARGAVRRFPGFLAIARAPGGRPPAGPQ
jgi:2-polyprenyl-3-methyl-5-hydroxy-6-metoxy-1,4-benzoquinol methylase